MNRDENDFLNTLPDVIPEEQDGHNQDIIDFLRHTSRNVSTSSTEEHAQALARIQSRLFSDVTQSSSSAQSTPLLTSNQQRIFQKRRNSMETSSTRKTSKSYPRLNTLVAVLCIVIIVGSFVTVVQLIRASHSNSATGSTTTGSGVIVSATVHMGPHSFLQSSVTIKKGTYIQLVNDTAVQHIIENGYWTGSREVFLTEKGLPNINTHNIYKNHQLLLLGPFLDVGTYHLLDTIHGDMTLIIHVV